MITEKTYTNARQRAEKYLRRAGLVARDEEIEAMEVLDMGLSNLEETGLQILSMVETDAIAVKVLVLFPQQTFVEHRHPSLGDYAGKEETLRCQWGEIRLYVPGEATPHPRGAPPAGQGEYYTSRREIVLHPGEQHTVPPNTWHWFQAGEEGGVVWSFSTRATDAQDEFQDPRVVRETIIT
ncbi:MAG: D-lyxose/D-mannose family sugar isomerase [Chloroflexota bacterium]|nr:D-lyxose/D-mannose family sugar isomerase [Chloroflexota bacterium]